MASGTDQSPRRYAGKAARERRAQRRSQLIAAGIEIIGTRGYQAASVKAVCTEAKLTERYFYESFENREALLCAVYEHLNEVLRARTLEALMAAPDDPVAKARAGAEVYFRMLRDDPRTARILLFEAVGVSETLARLNRVAEAEYVALIREVSRRYHPEGQLPADREILVAAGLFGAGVNIAMRWVLGGYRESLEDVIESTVLFYEAIGRQIACRATEEPGSSA